MNIVQGLVACSDFTGYARLSSSKSDSEIFEMLSDYYEWVGDVIAPVGGSVVKFMGDGALMFFPDANVDAGVCALLDLQRGGDTFLAERDGSSRHCVRVHFGPVCLGELGTRNDKRTDITGAVVNALFLLKTEDAFTLTPEAFQKLTPETGSLFQKRAGTELYFASTERQSQ